MRSPKCSIKQHIKFKLYSGIPPYPCFGRATSTLFFFGRALTTWAIWSIRRVFTVPVINQLYFLGQADTACYQQHWSYTARAPNMQDSFFFFSHNLSALHLYFRGMEKEKKNNATTCQMQAIIHKVKDLGRKHC